MSSPDAGRRVWCVDFGSTFTKAALVDLATGDLVAAGSHRTTIDTDVLDGWAAIRDELRSEAGPRQLPVLACSSAGGGLRIAVVGNEELVTAEAGRRVALSSGGRVVHVSADAVDLAALRSTEPDVVLLVGGTDGGNSEVLLHNAQVLARARWRGSVVVAGNAGAADQVALLLSSRDVPFVVTDNVVPRIGTLAPKGARAAIREMFLRHVIGGKHLSRGDEFVSMVRGPTPDVVLTAVELLAAGLGAEQPGAGNVAVVDIGGATTDVHSVVDSDPEDVTLGREVVASVPVTRTVEGDLGMRWSAVDTVQAAVDAGLHAAADLYLAAEERRSDPGLVPSTERQTREDLQIAEAAATLAIRRHAGRQRVAFGPDGRLVERTGKDLREVRLLVGSGGVLRHHPRDARAVLSSVTGDKVKGGWLVPRAPRIVIDSDYVLAAAGLLAEEHPVAAYRLLGRLRQDGPT